MKQIVILGYMIVCLAYQPLVAGPTNSPPSTASQEKSEFQQFMEETAKLPPAERGAKIKAFTEKHGLNPEVIAKQQAELRQMTPEQRTAKLQGRLRELRNKKASATLTPSEQQQLRTLEDWANRTRHATNSLPASTVSTNKPSKTK